jgi:hypothetical protein
MKKTVIIVSSAVVLIAAALGVSFAVDKGVTWTPGQVSATAVWAKASTSSISFVSDKNLNKVDVRIDPALQPYLSVAPASLGKVSKDQQVTLTLTFAVASNTPPHVVSGNLTLFKDNGAAKVFGALPVTVSLEPLALPPAPGDAGKATLEGIDSDHDGIRDDIQRYIALTYWSKPEIAAGLRQYAMAFQDSLVGADSKEVSLVNQAKSAKARECLRFRLGLEEGYQAFKQLQAFALNTEARSRAYIAYNSQLGGQVFSLPNVDRPESCEP